ncbi:uncharacterized protein RHOBADRAFT_52692 [Rhodotorula graminis WP1]|uniref:Translocation protein sec66 n=1 Tax=Rhodotorula graminis (strain WP1) TaxID=578459 RepID=A0A194S4I6_RHOGW|nr:uncharacterized protein RHOBADRAFT_52692 [Rhodotorula graminis WP1]KPV75648.1 hypothetical protein RHOBADRAFT_52692 [Rhodotorula graminis WP1]
MGWVVAGGSGSHRATMTLSILAPLSYIGFLVGSLWLFSKIYRRRQANKPRAEPWFPPHKSRDIYVSLLSLDPPPPRPILVAALLRRAMDDVKLIWQIRDAKTSLTTLLGKGQIGDDLWERFLLAEKELEAEIVEVVGEANTFEPGYGNKIFNAASDMVSHERWKDVYRDIAKRRAEENAKLSSGLVPAPVLAPTPYLTPSSLTLAPSNPLPLAGTTPSATCALRSLEPLGAAGAGDVTSVPPSRGATPAAAVEAAAGSSASAQVEDKKEKEVVEAAAEGASAPATVEEEQKDSGASTPAGSTPASPAKGSPKLGQTPSTTPKKRKGGKKGKGGR